MITLVEREQLPYIRTFTGLKFRHLDPRVEDICIEDIAHALSNICRFTGHTKQFYSVAEHCIRGSYYAENPLKFLLHDASEAYCADLARPIKYLKELDKYREIEHNVQEIIAQKFGLVDMESPDIKVVDDRMLATEMRDLVGSIKEDFKALPYDERIVKTMTPEEAEALYLSRFYRLRR